MRIVRAIALRELRALLHTATGWWVAAGFQFLAGVFWLALVDTYAVRAAGQVFDSYAEVQLSTTDHLLAPFFGNVAILVLVVGPAVTMRLFADEARQQTRPLLASAPITAAQIVAGKFLGAFAYVFGISLSTAWMPLSLFAWSSPDVGAMVAGYLALASVGAAVCALGSLTSAVTEHPLVALVLAFSIAIALWILGWVDPDPTSWTSQLSMAPHVRELVRGALRASDLAYFVLLSGWCLFATWQRVDAWRYT